MRLAIRVYIGLVVVAAATAFAAVYASAPAVTLDSGKAVLILGVLALLAESLGFLLPRSTRGSLSFTAFVAMGILVPAWPALISVLVVKLIVGITGKTPPHKALFNIASFVMALAMEIAVFRVSGGVGMLSLVPASLAKMTVLIGVPAALAFAASYLTNTFLVSGAIALETRSSVLAIWREMKISTLGLDILVAPAIFLFAWVYAVFGAFAAATLWVPLLGLRQLHKTNLELEQTNEELLELMVKSLEARDPYTSGHSRRVRLYSVTIARALGLSKHEVDEVARAALLHDVGKIHEKYASLLQKTDKLSPGEWATMKDHPADGAELVATMSKLRDVVPAIRHHHEDWDGSGYPDGLAGELIPLASRIIRFADTIDAMTTERPYRHPMTEAEVRDEVVRCRGTQFDPYISDVLLASPLWMSLFASPATGVEPSGRARLTMMTPQNQAAHRSRAKLSQVG